MLKRIAIAIALTLVVIAGLLGSLWINPYGQHEGPGEVTKARAPADEVESRARAQRDLGPEPAIHREKQILFGDLHVHTTFSSDAFFLNLPLLQGVGAHPPADACDFARFCSALDFWSINDHAESLTPRRWQETIETIRQCNAVGGEAKNPDTVAFLGWEWTQVGSTPEEHYGHKNVILRGTAPSQVPTRPIAARGANYATFRTTDLGLGRIVLPLIDFPNRQRYLDLDVYFKETRAAPDCPPADDVRSLPADCVEAVATPGELFEKLDQWGFESIVIPHGTTWGATAPRGASWAPQLRASQHDARLQTMIEVYSGHGGSEEYRDWRHVEFDDEGAARCPPPRKDFTAGCWRAGEVIRQRCLDAGETADECESRAAVARRHHVAAGGNGFMVVPGQQLEDWLDSGQCRDCFTPAYGYRPGMSVQAALAARDFSDSAQPTRFRFGLIASSDNHSARPGTGYKEMGREGMSDNRGVRDAVWGKWFPGPEPAPESIAVAPTDPQAPAGAERSASFMVTGGLVALHAEGRDRDAIWTALKRNEVYGTSGPRILLWFDLLDPLTEAGVASRLPMGGSTVMHTNPRFRVRAVGALEQSPGCPDSVEAALGAERLAELCMAECYYPSDRRQLIERIEVVRIRPQTAAREPLSQRIEDPWLTFACEPDPSGCSVEFADSEFASAEADTVYYVRAVQRASAAVNGGNLRCRRDSGGSCIEVQPCRGGYHRDPADGCLSEIEERAWSSPIFVDYGDDR